MGKTLPFYSKWVYHELLILSSHEPSDDEKSLFCKCLNFSISPKRLDYVDQKFPFESLIMCINKNEMPNEDKEFIKSRLKYFAFTVFWLYNYNSQTNLTKNETLSLNNHSNNNNHQKI